MSKVVYFFECPHYGGMSKVVYVHVRVVTVDDLEEILVTKLT